MEKIKRIYVVAAGANCTEEGFGRNQKESKVHTYSNRHRIKKKKKEAF